jgi:hypothetical protein
VRAAIVGVGVGWVVLGVGWVGMNTAGWDTVRPSHLPVAASGFPVGLSVDKIGGFDRRWEFGCLGLVVWLVVGLYAVLVLGVECPLEPVSGALPIGLGWERLRR